MKTLSKNQKVSVVQTGLFIVCTLVVGIVYITEVAPVQTMGRRTITSNCPLGSSHKCECHVAKRTSVGVIYGYECKRCDSCQ